MFHIIREVHIENGKLKYTPVGYVSSRGDADYIHSNSGTAWQQWASDNLDSLKVQAKSQAEYLDTNVVYVSGWDTTDITGFGLCLITNLDNPSEV